MMTIKLDDFLNSVRPMNLFFADGANMVVARCRFCDGTGHLGGWEGISAEEFSQRHCRFCAATGREYRDDLLEGD